MSGLRREKTLFDAVPALGAISAHGGEIAMLLPVNFDHPGFILVEGTFTMGRDPVHSDCVVPIGSVSRTHCEILVVEGQIWIKDLGSQNGTFINGEQVTQHQQLQPGDKLGLSAQITFVLAMDEDMEQPLDMEVEMDGGPTVIQQRPEHPSVTNQQADSSDGLLEDRAQPDAAAVIEQLERQRNVLAILYQISLRCLMEDSPKDVELLLTNVLQRLVPMEIGFLLYNAGGSWRAAICPGSKRQPSNEIVRSIFALTMQEQQAMVVQDDQRLRELGLGGGAALVAPMILNDKVTGFLAAYSSQTDAYDDEALDIVRQVAKVSAAALKQR